MMAAFKPIDIVLVGRTGTGKSSTGNSILRKQVFKSSSGQSYVSNRWDSNCCEFNDRKITVTDGPSVGEGKVGDLEAKKLLQEDFEEIILSNGEGYNAFIFVVKFGERFTDEDSEAITCLKQILGDYMKDHCIIVMTCGDNFGNESDGLTFETWCQKQGGIFRELLMECSNRIALFDNKTKDDQKNKKQISHLLSLIDSLGGKRYTEDNFKKAEKLRQLQLLQAEEPQIHEKTNEEAGKLHGELRKIKKKKDDNDQKKALEEITFHAEMLLEGVKKKDNGTNILMRALHTANAICSEVKSQREFFDRLRQERKEAEEKELQIERENDYKMKKEKEEIELRLAQQKKEMEERRKRESEEMEEKFRKQNEESERKHKMALEEMKRNMEKQMEYEKDRLQRQIELQKERRQEEERKRIERENLKTSQQIQDKDEQELRSSIREIKEMLQEMKDKQDLLQHEIGAIGKMILNSHMDMQKQQRETVEFQERALENFSRELVKEIRAVPSKVSLLPKFFR